MSHYTIDYSTHLNEDIKQGHAIEDIIDWLGNERFVKIENALLDAMREGSDDESLGFYIGLAGISGYPVNAWLSRMHQILAIGDELGLN